MNSGTRDLLERHFDTAFAAPDGIKKLRELILTLAMQGKLVPQDPSDPPASQLLKEIAAEKKRLVKEGKIKAPKPMLEVRQEERPYPLPHGWTWVHIRDICHDWGQKTPDSRFTYIDVGSINNEAGVIGQEVQVLESHEAPSRARKIVQRGTVIYSTVRPYLLNIAIIEEEFDNEPIASTAFAILHPFAGVNNRFIYCYLRSPAFIKYVEGAMKGVAYPAINDGDFFQGYFPLPPHSEQHRIVAKIDQLMARCDELERLRAEREQKRRSVHTAALKQLLDAQAADSIADAWQFISQNFGDLYAVKDNVIVLRKAVLQLAVMGQLVPQNPNDPPASQLLKEIEAERKRLVKEGKIKAPKSLPEIQPGEVPYALPQGWEWSRMATLAESIDYGTSQKTGDDPSQVPVYRMGNIVDGRLIDDGFKYISPGIEDLPRLYLKKNDILFNRTNSYELVGKSAPYLGRGDYATFASYLIRVRIFERDRLPSYVSVAMNAPFFRATQIEPEIVQQCGQANFNGTKLSLSLIPVPPLPEQHRIAVKYGQVMALCDRLEQQIDDTTGKQAELLDALMEAAGVSAMLLNSVSINQ